MWYKIGTVYIHKNKTIDIFLNLFFENKNKKHYRVIGFAAQNLLSGLQVQHNTTLNKLKIH